MSHLNIQEAETHESKQRGQYTFLVYGLVSFAIGIYIEEAGILFGPYVQNMLTGSDNTYERKLAIFINSVIVFSVLFPFFWSVKKMIGKKYQNELMPINPSDKKEFSFSIGHTLNTVILDDMSLHIKTGFSKKTILMSRLRYFYLWNTIFSHLMIRYEDDNGKIKKYTISADAVSYQMRLLSAEMDRRFPDKSLNNLPVKQAFKILKKMTVGRMLLIVFTICVVVGAILIMILLDYYNVHPF